MTPDPLTPTMVKLISLIAFFGLLGGCGGIPVPKKTGPALKPETVKYDWLELTVGEDGEHVYRAEIDSARLRQRDSPTVEIKVGEHWINAASATKKSILSGLGEKARPQPIKGSRIQEAYHGADNEIIFLGGSFAFQGDMLRMVALLDGSDFRIGGEGGKVIHIECERSTIEEIMGQPAKTEVPKLPNSKVR